MKEKLIQLILDEGACEAAVFSDSFKGFSNGISFAVKLSSAVVEEISDAPTYAYFQHYRAVNALIDRIALVH